MKDTLFTFNAFTNNTDLTIASEYSVHTNEEIDWIIHQLKIEIAGLNNSRFDDE